MFDKFKNYLIGRLIKVGNKKTDLSRYYDMKLIEDNISIYEGNPKWNSDGKVNLNLGAAVASELARKATIEFESKIDGVDGAEYLDEQYQALVKRTREIAEKLIVQGNIILKPFIDESASRIAVEAVNSRNFIPLKFNSIGEMTSVAFLEVAKVGDRYYTKFETHDLDESSSIYTVTNKAYEGRGINYSGETGSEVILGIVPEWSELETYVELSGIEKPLFVHMKTPYANNDDIDSPLGVSVYSKIRKQLIDFDSVYADFMHDLNFKRAKIFVPHMYLEDPENIYGLEDSDVFSKLKVPNVDSESANSMLIDVFNPELRVDGYSESMEVILRKIEFNAGLAYGDLSDASVIDKTATEVRASKERSWSTIVDLQKQIENAYRDVIDIMIVYINLYSESSGAGLERSDLDISFHFDDSIVVDEEYEMKLLLEEVKAGLISNQEYLIRRYGVTEEDALRMMGADNKKESNSDVSYEVNEEEDEEDEDNDDKSE